MATIFPNPAGSRLARIEPEILPRHLLAENRICLLALKRVIDHAVNARLHHVVEIIGVLFLGPDLAAIDGGLDAVPGGGQDIGGLFLLHVLHAGQLVAALGLLEDDIGLGLQFRVLDGVPHLHEAVLQVLLLRLHEPGPVRGRPLEVLLVGHRRVIAPPLERQVGVVGVHLLLVGLPLLGQPAHGVAHLLDAARNGRHVRRVHRQPVALNGSGVQQFTHGDAHQRGPP